jgi:tetratricopeptide (TPR) repeat protein
MSANPISEDNIQLVKQSFIDDPRVTDDIEPGTFFEDPLYYDSLPPQAKNAVNAVQMAGAHPNRPAICYMLSERFFQTSLLPQQEDNLQGALALGALSLWYVPPQHPGRGKSNRHMGVLFQRKWNTSKAPEDLDRAIRHYRLATEHAAEPDDVKASWFTDLGVTLNLRYQPGDFEEIERCYDRSIELSSDSPWKAMFLSNKGYFLIQSAKEGSSNYMEWINRACDCHEQAVALCKSYLLKEPRPNIQFRRILNNACAGFYAKWDIGGGLSTIDAVIESNRLSADIDGGEWSWVFYRSQAQYFLDRHELTRNLEDLVEATVSADKSLSIVGTDEAGRGDCEWVSGKIRRRWYDEDQKKNILQEAIDIFKVAIELLPKASSSRYLALNDLGNAYIMMFNYEAQSVHLENGIASYRESLASIKELKNNISHDDILMINSSLGFAMLQRYLFLKSEGDLNSSISYYQRSLTSINSTHRRYAMRAGNLSYVLQLQFTLRKDPKLLTESQNLLTSVINGPLPLTPIFTNWLETHLGNAFIRVEETAHTLSTVNNAIEHYDVALTEPDVPLAYRSTTMSNRAIALKVKADITGLTEDFEASVKAFAELGDLISEDDPLSTTVTFNLGTLYLGRYEGQMGPDRNSYGIKSLNCFSMTAQDTRADPGLRIGAASTAAMLAYEIEKDYSRARDFICMSIQLLPETILLHESRLVQLEFVRKFHYVPSSAAAISIAAGDSATMALNRLEGSRATIWDRLFGLKTPLDALRAVNEELADKFQSLQTRLSSRVADTDKPTALTDPGSILPKDEARMGRQKDAEDYRKLLIEIRNIDGMSDFLKPPNDSIQLQNYAKEAPIIFINASRYRTDAIVITKDKVLAIPLPNFDMNTITEQAYSYYYALDLLSASSVDSVSQAYQKYKSVTRWLWYSAVKPILESIDFSKYPKGLAGKHRVYWASTGWANVFPIHAAGDYEKPRDANQPACVHDLVVSLYTTSLKSLTFIRQNAVRLSIAKSAVNSQKGIIVTMASTPGLDEDHNLNVEGESKAFEKHISPLMTVQPLPTPGSKEVKAALETCTIAHFACHASADRVDPSKSALLLQDRLRADGRVKDPPTFCVRTLLNLDLKHCQIVYLSACETGANRDIGLRDEGIHLASGFHMAGVPHVISTLWRVDDTTSTRLANLFYGYLRGTGKELDYENSADALHLAIGELRDEVEPMLWGPFVYSGP